jgi:hypothetical protein
MNFIVVPPVLAATTIKDLFALKDVVSSVLFRALRALQKQRIAIR